MSRLLLACVLMGPCSTREKELRGWHEPSPDGGTLLAIDDCWSTPTIDKARVTLGVPVAVKPGPHVAGCGGEAMEIAVPRGRTYHFDYWGP